MRSGGPIEQYGLGMEWLSPQIATALSAVLIAFGALLGVLVRGSFDLRLASRQMDVQLKIAVRQIEAQRSIAAAQRAEDRAKELLAERRVIYERLVGAAWRLPDAKDWFDSMQRSGTVDQAARAAREYEVQVETYRQLVVKLRLIAPNKVLAPAVEVSDLCGVTRLGHAQAGSKASLGELNAAVWKLYTSCREDLQSGEVVAT